jgi:pyruvate dehydrogenase E2 component (dihydrolipoamide acetyltransferase)
MAEVIRMPRMSDTMEEGVIASWLKKVGDEVKSGDVLAEVETDKATMELEAYDDGVLLFVGVEDKKSVPVDGVLAVIGEKGENIDELLEELKSESSPDSQSESKKESGVTEVDSPEPEALPDFDSSQIEASLITMPKMSDTMSEGTIASWHKKVGDPVKSGDILAEVETDKATMELEAYEDGTLLYVGVKEGESVEIDGIIAVIGEKGANFEKLIAAQSGKAKTAAPVLESDTPDPATLAETPESLQKVQATENKESKEEGIIRTTPDGKIKASPLARKLAKDLGYDLSKINGSGDFGRIIKRDVEAYTPSVDTPAAPGAIPQVEKSVPIQLPKVVGEESYEEISVSQMRKTIARRLSESKYSSPHFYLTMEINMDKAIEARKSMNEVAPVKISFNDLVVKAAAASLRRHPKVNASWLGDKIRFNHHIHIGIAVAVEEGLLVPVVRFADNKSLSHISVEVKDLGEKARNKQLQPSDWEGNTFTISNLGMFGIEEFTAIINPPDACIMAVGGIKQTAIVKDGQLVPGNVMKVTLSCDHRVVDGATGAAFLQTFKEILEDPVRILI